MARSVRSIALELSSTLQLLSAIFICWKALSLVSNCRTPIVVVTSESMEPGFQIGDVLFLWNRQQRIRVGDEAPLWLPNRQLPMAHRVIQTHSSYNDSDADCIRRSNGNCGLCHSYLLADDCDQHMTNAIGICIRICSKAEDTPRYAAESDANYYQRMDTQNWGY